MFGALATKLAIKPAVGKAKEYAAEGLPELVKLAKSMPMEPGDLGPAIVLRTLNDQVRVQLVVLQDGVNHEKIGQIMIDFDLQSFIQEITPEQVQQCIDDPSKLFLLFQKYMPAS